METPEETVSGNSGAIEFTFDLGVNLQSVSSRAQVCVSCRVIAQVELGPVLAGVHADVTDVIDI